MRFEIALNPFGRTLIVMVGKPTRSHKRELLGYHSGVDELNNAFSNAEGFVAKKTHAGKCYMWLKRGDRETVVHESVHVYAWMEGMYNLKCEEYNATFIGWLTTEILNNIKKRKSK